MNSERRVLAVGLGEVLWDVLPSGRRLGGAPANFAYYAALLGDLGTVASRVGRDAGGEEAVELLREAGVDAGYVQRDDERPTGSVFVRLDPDGQPTFDVGENAAWDNLKWTPEWEELAARADTVCFGTLAQRTRGAREAVRSFLRATRAGALRLFDANLRQNFYDAETLDASLELASAAKLNRDELPRVVELLKLGGRGENAWAHRLIQVYGLDLVCVTRGARGSLLVTPADVIEHEGFNAEVADAVGAGDAFAATLAHYLLRGAAPEEAQAAANRAGAWAASHAGAMPPADPETFRRHVAGATV